MRWTFLATTTAALFSGSTFAALNVALVQAAETDPVIEACKNLSDPVERLDCYGTMSRFSPSERETASGNGWEFIESSDAFSVSNTFLAYPESDKANMMLSDVPSIIVVRRDGPGGHKICEQSNGRMGVLGRSMEQAIPDSSWCLFIAPVEGKRQSKTVLVQLLDATDPETGRRCTVNLYTCEKVTDGDAWRHAKITLMPVNPDFEPVVLSVADQQELQAFGELIEVLEG